MEDVETQRHAYMIAHAYNVVPYDPLKCERVIHPETDLCSLFFANTNHNAKAFVQYHADEIENKRIQGDVCTCCWSADKIWQDETVPKYVFCSLSGFDPPVEFLNEVHEPGEPPKLGCYMLEQKNAPDCTYEYLDDTKEIIWTPDDVLSTLIVTTKPDDIVRMNASAAGCFKMFQEDSSRAEITLC